MYILCIDETQNTAQLNPDVHSVCQVSVQRAQLVASERNFEESDAEKLLLNWDLLWEGCVVALRLFF